MGVRASYVAVVIVVVGVDASLIPVNGLLGLNRRGLFVWAGSIIHLLHSRPPGEAEGGVADKAGTALALKASLSAPPALHPSSASSSLTSHSWLQRWNGHQSKLGDDPGLSCLAGFHVR